MSVNVYSKALGTQQRTLIMHLEANFDLHHAYRVSPVP